MEKKDLLQYCRYYKGNNDIKASDPDKQVFRNIEKNWVELTIIQDNILSEVLCNYIIAGLKDFEKYDNTPLVLKALLFNRFTKYNERMDITAFKKWYHKYTNKGED